MLLQSTVVRAVFTAITCTAPLILPAQMIESSQLSILVIDLLEPTDTVPDEPKALAQARLWAARDGDGAIVGDSPLDYDGAIAIERRGATSQGFPKRGFGFELRGGDGRDTSASLLGMPEEEDWVLHGPYSDKTLIRNAFAYTMAAGLSTYAPRCRFVELNLNGRYWGLYLLTESVKRDGGRVDVAKLTAADTLGEALTGGYLLKSDRLPDDVLRDEALMLLPATGLIGAPQTGLVYHYPKPERLHPKQRDYITAWMTDLEARLASEDFEDPVTGYAPLIDEESFMDFLFVQEITKNVDAYVFSTYLYKERDRDGGRLHMGPVWDFNLALGNANYDDNYAAGGFRFEGYPSTSRIRGGVQFWWMRLYSSASYRRRLARQWRSLREDGGALSDERLFGIYDSLAAEVAGPVADRNFERWPVLGSYIWPNVFVGDTHAQELSHARTFLRERLAWLDETFDAVTAAPPIPDQPGTSARLRPFPNPVGPRATVTLSDVTSLSGVATWYDAVGRRVGIVADWPTAPLLAPDAPGAYTLRIVQQDGTALTGRLVVLDQ